MIHKYYDEHVRIINKENRIPLEMKRELDGISRVVDPSAGGADEDDELDIIFDDEANERELDDADIDDL